MLVSIPVTQTSPPANLRRQRKVGWGERLVVLQDPLLELTQLEAWLEPELLVEQCSAMPVGVEGLGVAAAPVEGEHELPAESLAQRMRSDSRLELGHELGMSAELKLGVDQLLLRGQAQLGQAVDLARRPRLVGEILKRIAAIERYRLLQGGRCLGRVFPPSSLDKRLKAVEVWFVRRNADWLQLLALRGGSW